MGEEEKAAQEVGALCLRCTETFVATGGDGLCKHCKWALPYEIEKGLREIEEFLKKEAEL